LVSSGELVPPEWNYEAAARRTADSTAKRTGQQARVNIDIRRLKAKDKSTLSMKQVKIKIVYSSILLLYF
jgi:hypothetical protein